ncbi:NADPH-dependent FMN reductase [Parafrigoribacterium soli]|uniref:NADPH-dependent FMN reductase n=1 Tax=Parafrigoribacterium soli TaxID=3144663 RepID=UPI0032EB38CD
MDDRIPILAICGSLRASSLNRALLTAAEAMAPELRFVGDELVAQLPLFNQDIEEFSLQVQQFREAAAGARGVVIASPEYVFSASGVTKNALDWLVGSAGLMSKPTLVMSASPGHTGGLRGVAALIPTLDGVGAVLLDPLTVSRASARIRLNGEITDETLRQRLQIALDDFRRALDYSMGAVERGTAARSQR